MPWCWGVILRQVLQRFREYDLKFKPKKCELFRRRVEFLGRQVSGTGVEMGDEYIEAVKDWETPTNVKDVERFLGFANYHRGFIAGFAQMAQPLYNVTGKKPFVWGPEQQTALTLSGEPSLHPRYWPYLQPMVSLCWIRMPLQKP